MSLPKSRKKPNLEKLFLDGKIKDYKSNIKEINICLSDYKRYLMSGKITQEIYDKCEVSMLNTIKVINDHIVAANAAIKDL